MSEPTIDPAASTEPPKEAAQEPAQAPTVTDWEAEARKWERRSKDNLAKLKDAEPKLSEYERIVESQKTDQQRQAEELARWQSEAEKWRTASVGHRIEALAGPDFADPSDAATALADPSKYLDAGGQINEEAIRADLAAVLERKPHWRRQEGTPAARVPAPNLNQGSGVNGRAAANPADELAAILQSQMNGSR